MSDDTGVIDLFQEDHVTDNTENLTIDQITDEATEIFSERKQPRRVLKTSVAQRRASSRYQKRNRAKVNISRDKSSGVRFIKRYATIADLDMYQREIDLARNAIALNK